MEIRISYQKWGGESGSNLRRGGGKERCKNGVAFKDKHRVVKGKRADKRKDRGGASGT